MSENKYSPKTNVLPPRCQYCSTELPAISTYEWTKQLGQGLAIMFAIFCPNADCRKILGTQIYIVAGAQESAIVSPH